MSTIVNLSDPSQLRRRGYVAIEGADVGHLAFMLWTRDADDSQSDAIIIAAPVAARAGQWVEVASGKLRQMNSAWLDHTTPRGALKAAAAKAAGEVSHAPVA